MRRRTFLVGCLAAAAGCGDDDGTAPTPTTAEPTPGASSPAGSVASFGSYLENNDVAVERLRQSGDVVTLQYVPAGETSDELSAEIGTIAGGYLREVETGWAVERLEATIVDDDGSIARWHVRSAWVAEYRRGEIGGEELSARILETLERLGETATD